MKVSFIGLGIMGRRMAHNLLKNGVDLTVYNRSQEPVEFLVAQGATAAPTANAAVQHADVIFSMLSTPEVVESIFFGPEGALANAPKGSLWADCTTVNPSFSRRAAAEAERHGIRFLDSPVAGTKPTAEAGQLAFFVGGDTADFETARPFMDHMGAKVIHLGEAGMGASFKMLVNSMLAQSMLIYSETVHLGQKMGLSEKMLLEVLPGLAVSAPFLKIKAGMMQADDYEVQFPLEWMYKDLHLATVTGYENDQALPMASLAKELYALAKANGLARQDFAAIHRFLGEQQD